MIKIDPLTENCNLALEKGEHVCIGISPFNSLFSEDYIAALVKWSIHNFKDFHLFIPDEPTFHTLEALGYEEKECRRKMKKQLNWLKNKMHKALERNNVSAKEKHILDWEKLSESKAFQQELEKAFALFDSDEDFRKECLLSSRWVLENKMDEKDIKEENLLKAVKYFLSEIPLFAATNKIIGSGTSLFCYHQSISFHERLYTNQLGISPSMGQGYGRIIFS